MKPTWSGWAGKGAEHAFEPGVVLAGTYRILRPIAAGGMGEVYAAAHERLPGTFAIKVLHRDLTRDADALARFRGEAEIMAGLRHPNIVQVIDFNLAADGTPYLVMELVDGRDLSELLREGQRLPPDQTSHMIRQIASALETAHARGVVHRDLKPENIMRLSLEGQEDFIKVVDFGISKARRGRITADAAILGTPQFMAPEQAQGRREEIDHRTDQFALASLTYMLLTGREPFRGDTAVTILYQVVHQDPEPLAVHVDWPCVETNNVLRRAMAKDRLLRFTSVMDFARALDRALALDLGPRPVRLGRQPPRTPCSPRLALRRQEESSLQTVRLRGTPRWRVVASLVGAAAVASTFLSLEIIGWDNLGSAVGGVCHQALAATTRTVARLRHARRSPVGEPEPRRGAEIIPLPTIPTRSTAARRAPVRVSRNRSVGVALSR